VNIGSRQRGRLKAASVIDCGETAGEIAAAIEKALSREFRAVLDSFVSPYQGQDVSLQIKTALKSADLQGGTMKRFHDQETNR
jgi:hypothetical protein